VQFEPKSPLIQNKSNLEYIKEKQTPDSEVSETWGMSLEYSKQDAHNLSN
jgi:hypothetical protein